MHLTVTQQHFLLRLMVRWRRVTKSFLLPGLVYDRLRASLCIDSASLGRALTALRCNSTGFWTRLDAAPAEYDIVSWFAHSLGRVILYSALAYSHRFV